MPTKTTILAILALPVGAIGYLVTASVLSNVGLREAIQGVVLLVVPLFVAGLGMAFCLAPMFDRMAKRDLAAHRAQQAAEQADGDEPHG